MFDVMKRHEEAIHELERGVHSRASKHELSNALALKANISDVSKTVAEVAHNIESRASEGEVQRQLNDKVSRNDLQYFLANKANVDEVKTMLEGVPSQAELTHELRSLAGRLDDLGSEMRRRVANIPTDRDISDLRLALE